MVQIKTRGAISPTKEKMLILVTPTFDDRELSMCPYSLSVGLSWCIFLKIYIPFDPLLGIKEFIRPGIKPMLAALEAEES